VGSAAYLAATADALRRRNKNKDAYDIVWLVEAWAGGQVASAQEIKETPFLKLRFLFLRRRGGIGVANVRWFPSSAS
jgi:hypothetical protein